MSSTRALLRCGGYPLKTSTLTLKFFGDTPAEQKAVIENTMERVVARVQPFDLAIAGVKIVRRGRRPQMVWATVTDSDGELRRLHGRTERLLEQGGFARERRPLSPHITLARVRDGIAPWEQQMLEEWSLAQRDLAPVPFRVEDVVLMQSELKPSVRRSIPSAGASNCKESKGDADTLLHSHPIGVPAGARTATTQESVTEEGIDKGYGGCLSRSWKQLR